MVRSRGVVGLMLLTDPDRREKEAEGEVVRMEGN